MVFMEIISYTKTIEEREYNLKQEFEQRATNELQQQIYYFNQPVIKFPITDENKLLAQKITQNMFTAMEGCGIGLAHNQLPKEEKATNPYAIFVIKLESQNVPAETFVNPIIVGLSQEKVALYHGCLSAIGTNRAKVTTHKEILLAFYSGEDLKLRVAKYTDWAAIICQHEFNHLATRGTYVDTVNNYVNKDRFKHAEKFFLTQQEIAKLKEEGIILENIGEDVPCLIPDEVLSRCKKALQLDKSYMQAVNDYLEANPQDKHLYDNLMAMPDTDLVLYEEAPVRLEQKHLKQ